MNLRIAHVHWAFPPTTGGVESHLADLVAIQAERGHAIVLLTGEHDPLRSPDFEIRQTPLLDLRAIRAATPTPGYAAEVRQFFRSVLEQAGVDVVHAHDLHHFTAAPALALDELRHELGFGLHHTFHETWPDVLSENPVYRAWDGNYAVSRFVQEGCAARLGFRPTLAPLGVDTARFSATRRAFDREDEPVILHPARLLPWKGVHVSVEMLGLLVERGHRVRLVLTDTQRIADWDNELASYRTAIGDQIARLGLTSYVTFIGPTIRQMPEVYADADVVLYPTVGDEPFGLVPLEAMSCSRPIVASASGGIAETVVDGVTGFTVERGNAAELARRVEQLLEDRALAVRMGAAGRRHVVESFDLREYAARLERSYRTGRPARATTAV